MMKEKQRVKVDAEKENEVINSLKEKSFNMQNYYSRVGMLFENMLQMLGGLEQVRNDRKKDMTKLANKYDVPENEIFDFDFNSNEIVILEQEQQQPNNVTQMPTQQEEKGGD